MFRDFLQDVFSQGRGITLRILGSRDISLMGKAIFSRCESYMSVKVLRIVEKFNKNLFSIVRTSNPDHVIVY